MKNAPHIYFCADDFGITDASCGRITECVLDGCLNKVSVLANTELADIGDKLRALNGAVLSVHLNLVEGRCVTDPKQLPLLADADGYFKNEFTGLLFKSLVHGRAFKLQVKSELRTQIRRAQSFFPSGAPLFLDSHQHTHMIPAVFSALCEIIREDRLQVESLRLPNEPLIPFLQVPSLYLSYFSINLVKRWVLRFCSLFDRRKFRALHVPKTCFFGIMFSGGMTEARVKKLLPHFIRYADKHGESLEILFHPGYIPGSESAAAHKDIKFKKFYASSGRQRESAAAKRMNAQNAAGGELPK